MQAWLLTVLGVALITFLLKLIIPEGNTKNLVLFIFSIVAVMAIMMPISNINENFEIFNDYEIELNQDYIDFANKCQETYYLTMAKSKLHSNGINVKVINFLFEESGNGRVLKKIIIKKSDLVIIENYEHINIAYTVKKLLSELFSINTDMVEIYE